jgi:transposase
MERLPRAIYTAEFRQQAVEMYHREKLGLKETAKRLSLSPATLKNWVYAQQKADMTTGRQNVKHVSEFEMEVSRLRRELAEVKQERDFLKKTAAYFAKQSS